MPVFPKKPRGFGPPRAKKIRSKFKPGDRVQSLHALGYTGLPVGAGALGTVLESKEGRALVDWGRSVQGWSYEDVLLPWK
jgi:hypothetical protein